MPTAASPSSHTCLACPLTTAACPCPCPCPFLQFKEYLARAEYLKGVVEGKEETPEHAGAANGGAQGAAAKGPRAAGGSSNGREVRPGRPMQLLLQLVPGEGSS